MSSFFVFLSFVCLGLLVAGLIKPSIYSTLIKSGLSRKKIVLIFGVGTIAALIVAAASGGNKTSNSTSSSSSKTTSENRTEDSKIQPEVKSPEPITLSGVGQQATNKFTLTKGISVFKMTHKGSANWAPKLLNSNGDYVDLLANDVGSFDGSKAVGIKKEGEYILDVTANGNWTIVIEQPRATDAPTTKSFSGDTQLATELFSLEKGLKTFKMIHKGSANWAPLLLDKDGNYVELLANDIGPFDGSKAVKINRDGLYLLNITANGDWTIVIE